MPKQNFTDAKLSFHSREIFPTEPMSAAETLTPTAEPTVRHFMGFGAAITPASCYNLSKMEKQERRALLESIYGPGGLGLSVGRVSIGACDYSVELYSTNRNRCKICKSFVLPVLSHSEDKRPNTQMSVVSS